LVQMEMDMDVVFSMISFNPSGGTVTLIASLFQLFLLFSLPITPSPHFFFFYFSIIFSSPLCSSSFKWFVSFLLSPKSHLNRFSKVFRPRATVRVICFESWRRISALLWMVEASVYRLIRSICWTFLCYCVRQQEWICLCLWAFCLAWWLDRILIGTLWGIPFESCIALQKKGLSLTWTVIIGTVCLPPRLLCHHTYVSIPSSLVLSTSLLHILTLMGVIAVDNIFFW
jgi:hypothetical protein